MEMVAGLEALAFPLTPVSGRGVVVEADERWRLDDQLLASDVDVLLWGRAPLSCKGSMLAVLGFTLSREIALHRSRGGVAAGLRLAAAHRLPPPARTTGTVRTALRSAATSGALLEFRGAQAGPRILDVVIEAAGGTAAVTRFRPGSGGASLARAERPDGTPVLIRLAPIRGPGDPGPGFEALGQLAAAGVRAVPLPCGRGTTAGASWSAETLLPGRRPRRLSREVALQVARFCARLPRAGTPPTALGLDLERIAATLPDRANRLRRLAADVETHVCQLPPAVLRHGDLWAGNLLVAGRRLVGVVDWDAWHPAAVPGADLLQLIATDLRHRTGRELGEIWLERPWRHDDYAHLARDYTDALGVAPDVLGEMAGVAWWAGEVAGTLGRHPERGADERWLRVNVDPVLAALGAEGS